MKIVLTGIGVFLGVMLFGLLVSIKWEVSEDLVSGIVYDNKNNVIISGNSEFKIRAAAEMYADENTSRTYCLPPNSEYIQLLKKAAADKNIKVSVKTDKIFAIMWPWECPANVTIEMVE